MSKFQSLTLSDIRKVFRLLSDVRELREDPERQQTHAIDVMIELLGASYGLSMSLVDFHPAGSPGITRMVFGSREEAAQAAYVAHWNDHPHLANPLVAETRGVTTSTHVATLSGLAGLISLDEFPAAAEFIRSSQVKDVMFTFFRNPGFAIDAFSFHRRGESAAFDERDQRMAQLFIDELHDLKQRGLLDPPDFSAGLPDSLRRLLPHLLGGKSQKEIAEEMGLSYQTIRSYTRDIYERFKVNSREGLVDRLRKKEMPMWCDLELVQA